MSRLYNSGFRLINFFFTVVFCHLLCIDSVAQPNIRQTTPVISGLNQPMQFVNAADGSNRVFIVHKEGLIKVYDQDFTFLSDFLTVSNVSSAGERGLLSMAFHPDYETNGYFYVYYTSSETGNVGDLTIARYQVSSDPNVADAASKVIVLAIDHPATNHNGGELQFGPDGHLYLSTGDGGGGGDPNENAQNSNTLLGKLLRIAVTTNGPPPYYTVPPDNPFGNLNFAIGLRNPYRWSFDRLNGDVWIGDVGQNLYEEINHTSFSKTRGINFGWDCYEGLHEFELDGCIDESNYEFPIHEYSPSGSQSVTGGVVYRDTTFPALRGWYVACDFFAGTFFLIKPNGTAHDVYTQQVTPNNIVDFGETESGEMYFVSLGSGTVYRLETDSILLPLNFIQFSAQRKPDGVALEWHTANESDLSHFVVEFSEDGQIFKQAADVNVQNTSGPNKYTYHHKPNSTGTIFYRIKAVNQSGSFQYTELKSVSFTKKVNSLVYPNILDRGELTIEIGQESGIDKLEMFSSNGSLIYSEAIEKGILTKRLLIENYSPGIYFIRLSGHQIQDTHRVLVK